VVWAWIDTNETVEVAGINVNGHEPKFFGCCEEFFQQLPKVISRGFCHGYSPLRHNVVFTGARAATVVKK
jgi:hypothetical protein